MLKYILVHLVHCGIVYRAGVCIDGLVHHHMYNVQCTDCISSSLPRHFEWFSWLHTHHWNNNNFRCASVLFVAGPKRMASQRARSDRVGVRARAHACTSAPFLFFSLISLSFSVHLNEFNVMHFVMLFFVRSFDGWFEAYCDTISLRYEISLSKYV